MTDLPAPIRVDPQITGSAAGRIVGLAPQDHDGTWVYVPVCADQIDDGGWWEGSDFEDDPAARAPLIIFVGPNGKPLWRGDTGAAAAAEQAADRRDAAAVDSAGLTSDDGLVTITLDTDGPTEALVGRFPTIADAVAYLSLSAAIDPDHLEAGRYAVCAPLGVGNDDEALAAARVNGYDVFWALGGAYFTEGPHSDNRSAWSKRYMTMAMAGLAACARIGLIDCVGVGDPDCQDLEGDPGDYGLLFYSADLRARLSDVPATAYKIELGPDGFSIIDLGARTKLAFTMGADGYPDSTPADFWARELWLTLTLTHEADPGQRARVVDSWCRQFEDAEAWTPLAGA